MRNCRFALAAWGLETNSPPQHERQASCGVLRQVCTIRRCLRFFSLMAEIFIKEAARRIFAVEGQAKGYEKGSAWEARAGGEPDNTAEPPRRGDLRQGPWISPGTGPFNHPWGTGGRAGIWTLDGLAQHGQVHLLPADPRHVFGSFCRATKGTRPQADLLS